jgi:hypothetical protein
LRAYQYRAGGNGNGFVWAVPEGAPFPKPEACPRLEGAFLQPPKPPGALDDLLDAIEGDGTPWSYMSASLFAREAAEFGALWHGCSWSTHVILGRDPWATPPEEPERSPMEGPTGAADVWTWRDEKPARWEPCYRAARSERAIVFYTFNGLGQEMIYRWTDTYKKGSYNFTTNREQVAEGRGGFVF